MTHMAGLAALCLLLAFSLSSSQSTLRSAEEISAHQPPAAAPPPPAPAAPPHVRGLLRTKQTAHLNAEHTCRCGSRVVQSIRQKLLPVSDVHLTSCWTGVLCGKPLTPALFVVYLCLTDAHLNKDDDKVGLFIAASVGTFALMAAVYCIYNKFYTKQQYLHTQLSDDSGRWIDPHKSGDGLEPALPAGNVRWAWLRMYKYSHLICHREQSGITTKKTVNKRKTDEQREKKKRRDKMRLKIKIETLPSQADTKRARLPAEDKWASPTSFASLISWFSFVLSITGQLGHQPRGRSFLFIDVMQRLLGLLGFISCSSCNARQLWNVYIQWSHMQKPRFLPAMRGNVMTMNYPQLMSQVSSITDFTTDPTDPPPVFFHTSAGFGATEVQRAGYGSLSDTPSIISVPPSLSPPPTAMPFPPLFLSSHSLRTISAKDLEKSWNWRWMPTLAPWPQRVTEEVVVLKCAWCSFLFSYVLMSLLRIHLTEIPAVHLFQTRRINLHIQPNPKWAVRKWEVKQLYLMFLPL